MKKQRLHGSRSLCDNQAVGSIFQCYKSMRGDRIRQIRKLFDLAFMKFSMC